MEAQARRCFERWCKSIRFDVGHRREAFNLAAARKHGDGKQFILVMLFQIPRDFRVEPLTGS